MEIVQLVAEGDTVVGALSLLGHPPGRMARPPATGRRFERIDEVYFFEVRDGRLARAWGLEDTLSRMRSSGWPTRAGQRQQSSWQRLAAA